MRRWIWCSMALLVLPALGSAQDLRAKADAAWAARENPAQTLAAIKLYEQLAASAPADAAVRIRLAQATYWAIEQAPKMPPNQQIVLLDKGLNACAQVLARDENHLEANHWRMWNMAAKTLAQGIFSGFGFKEAIVGTIMVAKANAGFQYGGVYRYWGRVIHEMPGMLGKFFHFTNDDAIWLYKKAIACEPKYLRNHFFLAESYLRAGKRADAVREFQFCTNQPDNALPEAIPENKLYKVLAKDSLARL